MKAERGSVVPVQIHSDSDSKESRQMVCVYIGHTFHISVLSSLFMEKDGSCAAFSEMQQPSHLLKIFP